VSGSVSQINAALTNASYTGAANFYGADTLSMTTIDTADNKTTGAEKTGITVADTATISESVPSSLSGVYGSPVLLAGISVADNPNSTDTLTTVLKVTTGTIAVATPGSASIAGNGSGTVTLTGTQAQINAALASASYTPSASNFFDTDTLSVTTTDPKGHSSATQTASIADNAPGDPDLGLGLGAGPTGALNLTNLANPTFSGITAPYSIILLNNDGFPVGVGVSNSQGQWEATALLPLSPGANQITATSIGLDGIATSTTTTVTEISGTTFSGAGQTQAVNFQAGNGNNTMQWADGVGAVIAGDGNNTVTAGNGADTIELGNGSNTVTLGNGNDSVTTGGGSDTVSVGNGNDTISVAGGNNTVSVGSGNNSITVGNGANKVTLGNGSDTLNLGSGANTVTLGDGSYSIVTPSNGGGNELILTVQPAALSLTFQTKDELVFANTGFDLGSDDGKAC
jgi:Ca2+-binding RTX toxin-like protein